MYSHLCTYVSKILGTKKQDLLELPSTPTINTLSARELSNKEIKEYHEITEHQYTLLQNEEGTYEGMLSDKGLELYNKVLEMVEKGQFKKHFTRYTFSLSNTGTLFNKTTGIFHHNTFHDRVIVGETEEKEIMQTSPVIFCSNLWCFTRSFSLYSLGTKVK